MLRALIFLSCGLLAFACPPTIAAAQTPPPSFPDVPQTHSAFNAVEYLKGSGILQGYADGTFRPDAPVNRAEALKIIVQSGMEEGTTLPAATGIFTDVAPDAWFAPFVEYAERTLRIIDGPPKKTAFLPTDPVKKAEFLKMILLARRIDPSSDFSDLRGALSNDVATAEEWFFPYLRYAVASSMTQANDAGLLQPGRPLTRGEVALLLFRLTMYGEGRRTQALLSEAESEISTVLRLLGVKDDRGAMLASNRALLAARGALAAKPDEAIVKGAVKTAEGFQALVRAYQAGIEGRLSDVSQLASDAWHLADKAKGFDVSLETLATQMQTIAKNMADEARALTAPSPGAPRR